jgi:hypothetical protein
LYNISEEIFLSGESGCYVPTVALAVRLMIFSAIVVVWI